MESKDVLSGDVSKLKKELLNDLIQCDGFKATVLGLAAEHGLENVAEFALRNGADPNRGGTIGGASYTPLCVAGEFGRHGVMKVLLSDPRTDPSARGGPWPALYVASEHNQPESVRLLLGDSRVDPNETAGTRYGSALCVAAVRGNEQVAMILLDDPRVDARIGNPESLAERSGHVYIAEAIRRKLTP